MAFNRPARPTPGDSQPAQSFSAQPSPALAADGPYGAPGHAGYAGSGRPQPHQDAHPGAGPGRPYAHLRQPGPVSAAGQRAAWSAAPGATGEVPLPPHAIDGGFLPPYDERFLPSHREHPAHPEHSARPADGASVPPAVSGETFHPYAASKAPASGVTGQVPLPGGWQPTPPRGTQAPAGAQDHRGTHSFGTETAAFESPATHDAVTGDFGTRTFGVHDIGAPDVAPAGLVSGDARSTREFPVPDFHAAALAGTDTDTDALADVDAFADTAAFADAAALADTDALAGAGAGPYQGRRHADGFFAGAGPDDEAVGEWNPTADSVRSLRGGHKVIKQRGGLARSSTVLGVGVIAAVGAGGIATAQGGKPPVHIAMPDLSSVAHELPSEARALPDVGHLIPGGSDSSGTDTAPLSGAGVTAEDAEHGTTDAGEALRERILQQAEQQQDQAETAAEQAAEQAAAKQAAEEAAKQKKAAVDKAAAEKKKAEEAARRKAEAERLAQLAKSFNLPVSSYTLTSRFGDPGSMWSSGYHTGLDFAAPTGTPLKAIHSATVKEAGWSGAYGYRTVLELDDGTELWYCHQSSISVSVGQKVTTGQVIGRVGATGNVTGPHLHLEVHPGGGPAVDPFAWLQKDGLTP